MLQPATDSARMYTVCFGACTGSPIVRNGHVIVCGRAKIYSLDYPTINVITALQQQQQQQQQQQHGLMESFKSP
jgi:hypothetical protein